MIALPSDAELVRAAAATYAPGGVPFVENPGFPDRVFRTVLPTGLALFSIEGTFNLPGWIGDFLALGADDHQGVNHPTLGFVHADFYVAALRLLPAIADAARKGPFAVGGHSRGAALAAIIGGLLIDDGLAPVKIGLFAPPRAGGAAFVEIVTSVPFCAYRFGNDPVTEVPFTAPPRFPYAQVPLIPIGRPMFPSEACHHIENYAAGVPGAQVVHNPTTNAAES